MNKELIDKKKIEVLERIVKAIFGRPNDRNVIKYSLPCGKDMTEVMLECDVDDAIKVLSNLNCDNIESCFYTLERPASKSDAKLFGISWEGFTEIHMFIETDYWKKVQELEKENKELRKKK